ncbi:hypothetical protein AS034_18740 [[Bacillus] enclensis]|uniref:DUF4367 domain-containing protein n=1 Tax=[Bacillus] enclensis TaxID=1402860 RepID=A0A0V8H9U6_9BACI|nr:hypothetical protein [[Bacillus] enclensis]KSU59469.1 hypothetical protein AS034_18740 [[Bacillus] enclensis]SCC30948.1 hypothetical protein GA0061094_3877 [[Bacillus] enclensis]
MDELSRLRGLMKEETFKHHGFTDKMRRNILNEIHSGKSKSSYQRRPVLAPMLSAVFMLACLSLFVYFGGSQLGIFEDGQNASQAEFQQLDLQVVEDDINLDNIKLPTVVPFEVVDRTYKKTREDGIDSVSIKLTGPEKQKLTINMDIGLESAIPAMNDPVEIWGVKGSYRENREFGVSHVTWYKDGTLYYVGYKRRSSNILLGKRDLKMIAESFK